MKTRPNRSILFTLLCAVALLTACGGGAQPIPTATAVPPTATLPAPTQTLTPLPPTATPIPALKLLTVPATGTGIALYDVQAGTSTTLVEKVSSARWSLSPDGSLLLFSPSFKDIPYITYLLDLKTGEVASLTGSPSYSDIIWHPSGKAFRAFNNSTRQIDLYSLSANRVVASFDVGEAFSPDGRKLAVILADQVTTQLCIRDINLDSSGAVTGAASDCTRVNFTISPSLGPGSLQWSPQGDRLAFDAQQPSASGINPEYIYTVKPDGSGLVKIMDSTSLVPGKQMEYIGSSLPGRAFSWSPDGSKIAFTAYNYLPDAQLMTLPQVFVADVDGRKLVTLTGADDYPIGEDPLWTPDGRLVFVTGIVVTGMNGLPSYQQNGLVIAEADGSNMTKYPGTITQLIRFISPAQADVLTAALPQPFTFNCATGWTRLKAGGTAHVAGSPGDPPNRVRSDPSVGDNLIGSISAGASLQVLDGPVCASGLVFWKVANDNITGGSGWTAEGDGTEYWLDP